MDGDPIKVGVLFSRTGSYAAIGEAMHAGANLALQEIAADPAFPVRLEPVTFDPSGRTDAYVEGARWLFAEHGIAHIVGCYTSSSRKELLPLIEKHDALLWYPSHYEGFETSDNVIYTGAAPNQHVIPLTRYLLEHCGRQGYFVGSNYIWAWENNRIMREALLGAGGRVLGERYFPVGETDLAAVARQILDARPDFVFNTLIGESAYSFYRIFRAEAAARGLDQPRELPVASCSLAEPELARIGDAADGHLSSSVYFSTVATTENARGAGASQVLGIPRPMLRRRTSLCISWHGRSLRLARSTLPGCGRQLRSSASTPHKDRCGLIRRPGTVTFARASAALPSTARSTSSLKARPRCARIPIWFGNRVCWPQRRPPCGYR
jgi:ABC-type branched-subunit amino acid transport system substrate-binding protein